MNSERTNPRKDPLAGPAMFAASAVAWALFMWWLVMGSAPGPAAIGAILALAGFLWWVLRR